MNLAEAFGSALGINADNSYSTPRTSDTATTDAVQSMQPVDNQSGGAFGDFWGGAGGVLRSLLDYAVVRDAARHGITPDGQPVVQMEPLPASAPQPAKSGGVPSGVWLIAAAGVLAFVVARASK
jgi:hypothetical protein